MTIPLVRPLPDGSSCLPGSAGARRPCGLLRARSLFGIAPGGACHAGAVASPPVGSYPTVSPLPARTKAVCSLWRYPWGCPRRALPGTIASWSPDFPRQDEPAAVIQPSARGSYGRRRRLRQPGMGALPPAPCGASPSISAKPAGQPFAGLREFQDRAPGGDGAGGGGKTDTGFRRADSRAHQAGAERRSGIAMRGSREDGEVLTGEALPIEAGTGVDLAARRHVGMGDDAFGPDLPARP